MTTAETYRQKEASAVIQTAKFIFNVSLNQCKTYLLGDLLEEIKTGKTPSKHEKKYYEDAYIDWYKPNEIGQKKYLDQSNEKLSKFAYNKGQTTIYKPNTILINAIGDVGRIAILRNEASSNQQITGIKTNTAKLNTEYCYYYLLANRHLFYKDLFKTTLPIVNQKKIKLLPIILPSIEKQECIVYFLNELENIEIISGLDKDKWGKEYYNIANKFFGLKENNSFISTQLTHQLSLVKQLRQAFLREAMQGKLLKNSPPLKEEYPQGEVVENRTNNLPHLKTFRKNLRNNLTPAEATLWTMLKARQLENRKFRRQFSVANYILDFYCPSENLAIELDGQGHFEASQAEYDYERDLFLNHCGIKVLRFENKVVWDNPEGLLGEVRNSFGWNKNPSVLRTAPLKGEQLVGEPLEDARDLLAKIKAEKALRQAQGTLRKQKLLPPILEEEIPFEIPENWVWCRLGVICEKIGSGSTPKGSNYSVSGFPFFRSQNIHNDGLVYNDIKYISDKVQKKMNGTAVYPNDILLNITGGSLGRCALVPNDFRQGNVSQHVSIIRPILLQNSFIHKLISSPIFQEYIFNSTTGAGREGLPKYNLEQFVIPLPPLSEQKRIVAKLDKLMAYCDSLEESIKNSQTQNEMLLEQVLREALEPKEKEVVE